MRFSIMMEMGLRKLSNGSSICFLLSLLLLLCVACKHHAKVEFHNEGMTLERFEIDNSELDSMVNYMVQYSKINETYIKDKVIVLELVNDIDSVQMVFSFQNRDNLVNKYIYYFNKRIVGYITCNNTDIIVLTNINSFVDFVDCFSKYIHPINVTKYFDYMYFPSKLYYNEELDGWNDGSLVYDPVFYSFSSQKEK